ncbi:MAG TPA: hypothetical protein VMT03_18395 [Polyangia bacterium]|nr:hypothetical protein [Polyangia bacterium]
MPWLPAASRGPAGWRARRRVGPAGRPPERLAWVGSAGQRGEAASPVTAAPEGDKAGRVAQPALRGKRAPAALRVRSA